MLPLLLALGCPDEPPSTISGSGSSGSSGSSSSGDPDGGPTTAMDPDTSTDGVASGEGSSSSGGMADSTTAASTGPDSDTTTTTGPLPDVGCADGEREALLDDAMYPDIAACAGGWSFPGVVTNTPMCDRMGGDDGPVPSGEGCAIDDLCAPGWHLCQSAMEVSDAGVADCAALEWDGSFFATRQSGSGKDTCGPVGTNDVFGCGDIGLTAITGCAPLNRSTGNGCVELEEPWGCNAELNSEAEFLLKESPDLGGALCCRD
ncbi:MAG: hypothetical protein AAGF11_46140 [Myxococcota bacterium]